MSNFVTSDLIFSEQANHNFSRILGDIKRSTLSIHNRLTSILQDATFAQSVADAYGRPLVANERCGSWYMDPAQKGGSAYFKSTDGHTGVWKFSLRRLNLHLLDIIGKNDGCIIIDSTRRGKRMPDALSKTIPIWCAVINRYLFPKEHEYHNLYTPPQVVSESEKAQISALLPTFVAALGDLKLQPENLRKHISKPLRPIWVTPESHVTSVSAIFERYHPIICCTVSRRVAGAEASEGGYIQGAGDDTENWAHGLTPIVFWENQDTLLKTAEGDLPELIEMLVRKQASSNIKSDDSLSLVKPTSSLFITKLPAINAQAEENNTDKITIVLLPEISKEDGLTTSNRIDVGLGPHKIGAKTLRWCLPRIIGFVSHILFPNVQENLSTLQAHQIEESDATRTSDRPQKLVTDSTSPTPCSESSGQTSTPQTSPDSKASVVSQTSHRNRNIIIACETGTQSSIGVGLAIVCLFFDDNGELLTPGSKRRAMNKDFIRSRLAWFSSSMPHANPSRDVLQSVNSFLMSYQP